MGCEVRKGDLVPEQETNRSINMKKVTLLIATATGLLTAPALLAQHNHAEPGVPQHQMDAHAQHGPALPKPVQAVFDSYIKIQTALAEDSLRDVNAQATAIAKAVQSDSAKSLPAEAARQANVLAKAKDLKAAREAFKPLSDSLIKYLDANKAHAGHYVKVFCPMAKARWLQIGATVKNPFFGNSMQSCGKIEI
jgi:hypothetical protein